MTDWLKKLTDPTALPLGIATIVWGEKNNDYISCTTKFVERGNHIVGESIFRVHINGEHICTTPHLEFALSRFENPSEVTE
jgi:hypothetical protein